MKSLPPESLKIESVNPCPKGGQQVPCVPYPIRVTHLPSGISVFCPSERSQSRNLAIAKEMIRHGIEMAGWSK